MTSLDQRAQTAPAPGSAVRLLPAAGGATVAGRLAHWSTSPAGLVATAEVRVGPAAAYLLGDLVWAHLEGPGGAAVVLEGTAEPGRADGEVVLTGVLPLASEHRRHEPRAELVRRAQLSGPVAAAARTVDLSRTGALLQLPAGADAAALEGAALQVVVEVGGGASGAVMAADGAGGEVVTAAAEVVRVDAGSGHVAVRFVDLAEPDADRIDRVVLAELSHAARAAHPPTT